MSIAKKKINENFFFSSLEKSKSSHQFEPRVGSQIQIIFNFYKETLTGPLTFRHMNEVEG